MFFPTISIAPHLLMFLSVPGLALVLLFVFSYFICRYLLLLLSINFYRFQRREVQRKISKHRREIEKETEKLRERLELRKSEKEGSSVPSTSSNGTVNEEMRTIKIAQAEERKSWDSHCPICWRGLEMGKSSPQKRWMLTR